MPIIYRDSSTWSGAAKQDGSFLLPETLPAKESAAVLIKLIFGPPYQQIIAAESVEAVGGGVMATQAISVYRRNHQVIDVTIKDERGQLVNCSGASLKWVIADAANAAVLTKYTGDGIRYIDASTGHAEITLTATDTDMPSGEYRHELLLTDIDGHRYTVLIGALSIQTSLTTGV